MVSRTRRGDDLTINIPPCTYSAAPARGLPSKGERLNIPPAPFKGGEVMVNRTERGDGQQDGER